MGYYDGRLNGYRTWTGTWMTIEDFFDVPKMPAGCAATLINEEVMCVSHKILFLLLFYSREKLN